MHMAQQVFHPWQVVDSTIPCDLCSNNTTLCLIEIGIESKQAEEEKYCGVARKPHQIAYANREITRISI